MSGNKKEVHYLTPYEAGARDAKAGIYDKWYRWHNKGEEYDKGWKENKDETLDYKVIEGY